mgnify:CR=1 FL=1
MPIIKIQRFDGSKKFFQQYAVRYEQNRSIMEYLLDIQLHLDATLGFEYSCRGGLCGACALNVDGKPTLACVQTLDSERLVEVSALNHLPLLKDLIVDRRSLHNKMQEVISGVGVGNGFGQQLPPDNLLERQLASCIKCNICRSICPIAEQEPDFFPAVFVGIQRSRLYSSDMAGTVLKNKAQKCLQCDLCSRYCPQRIDVAAAVACCR